MVPLLIFLRTAMAAPASTPALPSTMKATVLRAYGPVENLETRANLPIPVCNARDLLVQVKAFGLNPLDVKKRVNFGHPEQKLENPIIMGRDAAGIVVRTGSSVTKFHVGDEVYFAGSILRAGCYAEYCAVDERICGHKPHSLSFEQAAGEALTALTAFEAVIEQMDCRTEKSANQGKNILIIGGAGGVGSVAIQLASKVLGLHVVATASRPESIQACLNYGAHSTIDHSKDILAQTKALGLSGYDFILLAAEILPYWSVLPDLCKVGARVAMLASLPGPVDIMPFKPKRVNLCWEAMFARIVNEAEPERQGAILDQAAALLDKGIFIPRATVFLPWSRIRDAHRIMEEGKTIGKIVLSMSF